MQNLTREEMKTMTREEMIQAIREIKGDKLAQNINDKVEKRGGTEKNKTDWVRFALTSVVRNSGLVVKP